MHDTEEKEKECIISFDPSSACLHFMEGLPVPDQTNVGQ